LREKVFAASPPHHQITQARIFSGLFFACPERQYWRGFQDLSLGNNLVAVTSGPHKTGPEVTAYKRRLIMALTKGAIAIMQPVSLSLGQAVLASTPVSEIQRGLPWQR